MVKDHGLELFKSDHMVVVDVVIPQDLVHLFVCHVVAELRESRSQVICVNLMVIIGVELLEQRLETLLSRVLLHWEGRSDELVIVDDA